MSKRMTKPPNPTPHAHRYEAIPWDELRVTDTMLSPEGWSVMVVGIDLYQRAPKAGTVKAVHVVTYDDDGRLVDTTYPAKVLASFTVKVWRRSWLPVPNVDGKPRWREVERQRHRKEARERREAGGEGLSHG